MSTYCLPKNKQNAIKNNETEPRFKFHVTQYANTIIRDTNTHIPTSH